MNHPPAEAFGSIPQPSESFGTIPQPSEPFRTVRNTSERTENHTLKVRDVARLFEQAGVPRTERSIINWCQRNRQGVSRLDAFFDENEDRNYVTLESVNRAVEQERAKRAAGTGAATVPDVEVPKHSEPASRSDAEDSNRAKELERQNRDLEVATRVKDSYIERLEKDRKQTVQQLVGISRYVGELESQVLQLGGHPAATAAFRTVPTTSAPVPTPKARHGRTTIIPSRRLRHDAPRYTVETVIQDFHCKETEKIWKGKSSRRLPSSIQRIALRKLTQLSAAGALDDLRVSPGNRLEPLKGERAGQHSIRINDQWRVCFVWKDGHAHRVEIVNYH